MGNLGQRMLMGSLALTLGCSMAVCARAQQAQTPGSGGPPPAAAKDQKPQALINRLTIEVTGGDAEKPIENASVYLKTIQQGKLKDKKFEVNVKTNMSGVAHVPDAPTGRVEIQIVADGWKTYGRWYDVTDPTQTIKIHLERPPKWY
jgi:hypothetical protein